MSLDLNIDLVAHPLGSAPPVSGRVVAGQVHRLASRPALARPGLLTLALVLTGDAFALALTALAVRPGGGDLVLYACVLGAVLAATGAYRSRLSLHALVEAPSLAARAVVPLLVLAPLRLGDGIPAPLVTLACATALALPAARGITYTLVRALRRRRHLREAVIVVGAGSLGASLGRTLQERGEHGLELAGFVDDIDPAGAPAPLLGDLGSLEDVLRNQSVRRMIIAFGPRRDVDLVRVLRTALRGQVDVWVVPRFHEIGLASVDPAGEAISCTPLQRIRPAAPHTAAWRVKRAVDVAVAGALLLVLAPVLSALALGVAVTSPGPVLFRQQRVGQNGRIFELLKFRSLRVNDDSDVRWSVAGDDRQTGLGRWMRRLSLDELPQLWNVLRGDMSLIGPRPERPHFVDEFSETVDGYGERHRLPVGLTGLAQVNGLRGDTSIVERAKYDNHYIDHWTLTRDVSILVATVVAVVRDARRKSSA